MKKLYSYQIQVLIFVFSFHFGCYITMGQTGQYQAELILYEGINGEGEALRFVQKNVNDLEYYHAGFYPRSFTINGPWIWYSGVGFLGSLGHSFSGKNVTGNIGAISGQFKSFRYAGDPYDFRKDTLTIYSGTGFQGEQMIFTTHASKVRLPVKSIVITGNSQWRLYELEGYLGQSHCYGVPSSGQEKYFPLFAGTLGSIGFPYDTFKSVGHGCSERSNMDDSFEEEQ